MGDDRTEVTISQNMRHIAMGQARISGEKHVIMTVLRDGYVLGRRVGAV
jgi:hypothetical protein